MSLDDRIRKALSRPGVSRTPELLRVLRLPRRIFDASSFPDPSVLYSRPGSDGRLRAIQSAMLHEAAQANGGFFSVGIGQGKTLASFLLHDAMDACRTVLLVPASLKVKTLKQDLPAYSRDFLLPDIRDSRDFDPTKPDIPGGTLYILGYEDLSSSKSSDLLDRIAPDLIIADEAHKLRSAKAARTKRFLRYLRANPRCRFVAMTGSPMNTGLFDFGHLLEFSLREGSPLPRDYSSLVEWSDHLSGGLTAEGALALLCREENETTQEAVRSRLHETLGVIITTDISCDIPLVFRLVRPQLPKSLQKSLDSLSSTWSWNGEEFDDLLTLLRIEKQLSHGYYYRLVWPSGEPDYEWLEARNAWRRVVRGRLAHTNRIGQDSPALLEELARSGRWTVPEWNAWEIQRTKPEPETELVEVNRWIVDEIKRIAPPTGALIWLDSPPVGAWLAEAGIPYFGEGSDEAFAAVKGNPTCAVSWRAHGVGKNLQSWGQNVIVGSPGTNETWEQLIGRTHRPGQLASQVEFTVLLPTESALKAWENSLFLARKNEDDLGLPQRLNRIIIHETT